MTSRAPSNISYPVADLDGRLVWAADLAHDQLRPEGLACVGCGARLLLRAGERNAAHFAHYDATQCTSPETALHRAAKRIIADSINSSRRQEWRYAAGWQCGLCKAARHTNLAAASVGGAVLERNLGPVQPDIAILDTAGRPRLAVEVVVTHPPEPETLAWYLDNNIGVLVVEPTWEAIKELREGFTATAAHTMPCTSWRHPLDPTDEQCDCGRPVRSLRVELAHGSDCWRCKREVPAVDVIESFPDRTSRALRASDPSLAGIAKQVKSMRVGLRDDFSKTENRHYLMHHCPHCGAKAGDYFQYEHTAHNTLIAGSDVHHVLLCDGGHWTTLRTDVVPDNSQQRIIGAYTSERRSDEGWTGTDVTYETVTPQQAIRRMFGSW
jgi:hypothetical protein